MPRVCTACQHPKVAAINKELLAGVAHLALEKRYGVLRDALRRHAATHIPKALAQAAQAGAVASADTLLAQLEGLRGDAERIGRKAERARDYRGALAGVRELTRLVELAARLAGELREGVTVNVAVLPEWVALRGRIVVALAPYPEAARAVSAALVEGSDAGA